jgi:alpha-tubulin suppressor-like RCC1 family protein
MVSLDNLLTPICRNDAANGSVLTFGCGEHHQLGQGQSQSDRSYPQKVEDLKHKIITCVAVGAHHCLALSGVNFGNNHQWKPPLVGSTLVGNHCFINQHCVAAVGELVTWGLNNMGQCGLAHLEPVMLPTTVKYSRSNPRVKVTTLGQIREKQREVKQKKMEAAKKAASKQKGVSYSPSTFIVHLLTQF